MNWLAVKFKSDWFLFVQHRIEREMSNSVHIDNNLTIDTIVVKSFDTEHEAIKYCNNINLISETLEKL